MLSRGQFRRYVCAITRPGASRDRNGVWRENGLGLFGGILKGGSTVLVQLIACFAEPSLVAKNSGGWIGVQYKATSLLRSWA
jgi:hypothetical protein